MKRTRYGRIAIAAAVAAAMGVSDRAWAVDQFWDINQASAGATDTTVANGTWSTTSTNWTLDSAGLTAGTTVFTAANVAVFSAGTNATGASTITLSGTPTAAGIRIEEGTVIFAGSGGASIGAGALTLNAGTVLETTSSARIASTAGSTISMNNATLRSTNAGAAGSFMDNDFAISITGANTFDYTVANQLNISSNAVSGTGSLTKTGVGVLAIAGAMTYSGSTTINDGELRIRTSNDRLPIASAVTVTGPGILNLNGLSQTVGSLSGTGNVGTGAGTLTINGSANTVFDGALKNLASAPSGTFPAVTSGNGRLVKNGTGVITMNGVNDINGSVTLNAGGITIGAAGSLCGDIADIAVNGGTLTLNQASEIIENLSGTGGSIVMADNFVLTSKPVTTAYTTNASAISGNNAAIVMNGAASAAGTATVGSVGGLRLDGVNTYSGTNTVTTGSLVFGKKVSFYNGNTAQWNATNVIVASGATLGFGVGGTGEFASSDIDSLIATSGIFQPGTSVGFDPTNAPSGTFEYASNLSTGVGALGVTKLGTATSTLILSGTNTYTGRTQVIGGILDFASVAASPVGNGFSLTNFVVRSGGTLALRVGGAGEFTTSDVAALSAIGATTTDGGFQNNSAVGIDTTSGDVLYTPLIANPATGVSLGFAKIGANTLTVQNDNTYTGTTSVLGGTLTAVGNTPLGATTGALVVSNLNNGAGNDVVLNLPTTVGTTKGSLSGVVATPTTGTNTATINNGGQLLTINQTTAGTFAGTIAGSGGFTLGSASTATLTLSGASTYTGPTTVNWNLTATGGSSLGDSTGSLSVNNNTTGTGNTVTLTLSSTAPTTKGSLSGTIATPTTGTNNVAIAVAGQTFTVNQTVDGTYPGIISGTGNFTLGSLSTNTLSMTGASTFTGKLNLNGGTLNAATLAAVNANSSIGRGSTGGSAADIVFNGGTLQYTGAAAATTNRLFTVGTSGGTIDSSSSADAAVTFTGTGSLAFTGTGLHTLTLTGSSLGANSIASIIPNTTGGGAVVKNGVGSWTLGGANTYTGGTTVNAGTLSATLGNSLGAATSPLTVNNPNTGTGTNVQVNLSGTAGTTTGSLSGVITTPSGGTNTATINNNGQTYTVNQTTAGTFPGVITGAGGLALGALSTGTLTLTGANSYGGATTVNAGTLAVGAAGTVPDTSAVNVAGGTFDVGTVAETVGAVTLSSGSIAGTTGALTGTSYAVQSGSVSAHLAGAAALTKTTAGTVTLSAANSYTGGTTVSAGTLVVAHGDALAGGAIDIADGAVARAQAALPKAVTISTLNTNAAGKLDITNNSLVIKGMADSAVRTQLQSGYASGAWNGASGIVTTSVTSETSVGYATNAQLGNLTEFKGVTGLTGTDVLVKYTYAGDANLDGKVDIGDLGLLAGAWQQLTGKVWFDGDFTYDGAVDIGDLGLLAGNWQKGTAGNPNPPLMSFNEALAQFSAFDGVAVPEPTGLALLGVAGAGLLARRRRRD